ncbi:MAG TPA: hypothetical protein VFA46_20890 [Actinomycetes bacterium]|jgi:predicted transcriptional regulator|nr:hypothetical protein [Actinomycetes bacterium]
MVTARGLAPRLLLALLALAALAGCEQARQVNQGVDKARDCATLVKELANLNLDPQSLARAAGKAEDTVGRLDEVARDLDQTDVRRAAENLAAKVRRLADSASRSTPAQREQAVREVTDAAKRLASTCNVPIDQVIRTS